MTKELKIAREAASAAAKIQALCFEHELDLAKILAQGTDPVDPYVKFDFALPEATKADVGWKRTLFGGICRANFCQPVVIPKTSRMAVVGQKHNYEVICYTYEYLTAEIIRLAVDNCVKQHFLDNKERRKYIAGFCEGAMTEVYHALTSGLKRQTEATSDSRALVVVKSAELDKAVKVHFPRLVKGRRRGATGSSSGYSDGQRVGSNISVHRGVGGGSRVAIN